MKKNNAVQTAPKHSMLANQAPVPQKSKVSSQMTLSDSILSGAVVEFRKAGYRFMRHLHTNIEIYRILSGECYFLWILLIFFLKSSGVSHCIFFFSICKKENRSFLFGSLF